MIKHTFPRGAACLAVKAELLLIKGKTFFRPKIDLTDTSGSAVCLMPIFNLDDYEAAEIQWLPPLACCTEKFYPHDGIWALQHGPTRPLKAVLACGGFSALDESGCRRLATQLEVPLDPAADLFDVLFSTIKMCADSFTKRVPETVFEILVEDIHQMCVQDSIRIQEIFNEYNLQKKRNL